MSSSELPPTTGAGGKSVFSVFGFGGNRYSDDDFECPLETAPESFDASDYQISAVDRRKKKRGVSKELKHPVALETMEAAYGVVEYEPPSTHAYQMEEDKDPLGYSDLTDAPNIPRPMWAFIPAAEDIEARKMRVNLPENSSLVLPSFASSNGKPNPGQSKMGQVSEKGSADHKQHSYSRRYSTAQEEGEDSFNTEVLRKFNSTVAQSSAYLWNKNAGVNNSLYDSLVQYSKDDSHSSTKTITYATISPKDMGTLTRVQSSPHLQTSQQLMGKSKRGSSVDPSSRTSLIPANLLRPQSYGDLTNLVKHSPQGKDNTPSDRQAVTQFSLSDEKPVQADNLDSAQHSGFGLLSRTRQFGAWLTKATEGEKVEVTKKDLNVLAPNSF